MKLASTIDAFMTPIEISGNRERCMRCPLRGTALEAEAVLAVTDGVF
jgi:hypothetical protein